MENINSKNSQYNPWAANTFAGVPKVQTVRAHREAVAEINFRAKQSLGHGGRQAGKWLNWTVVGLPLGMYLRRRAGRRISADLQADLQTLRRTRAAVARIAPKDRTAAHKALLRETNTALRKFRPTVRTHFMDAVKGLAIAATVGLVLGAEAALYGAAIVAAAEHSPGVVFVYCYGDSMSIPNFSSSTHPKNVRPRDNDSDILDAPNVV